MKIKLTVAAIAISVILLAFWFWPYSDSFTDEYQRVTDEVVQMIEENPTKDGVEKARKHYNSRESWLRDRLDWGLKPDKDGVVSETVRNRYLVVTADTGIRLDALAKKYPDVGKDIDHLRVDMLRID